MKKLATLFIVFSILFSACNDSASNKVKDAFLKIEKPKSTVTVGQNIKVTITDDLPIDSIKVSGANFKAFNQKTKEITLHFPTVGNKKIQVLAYSAKGDKKVSFSIKSYPRTIAKALDYEILEVLEHNTESYTQGLEVFNGFLYESTGHYGYSRAKKLKIKENKVLKEAPLASDLFGEGLTILNDTVYQITWKKRKCLLYDPEMKHLGIKTIPTNEGWGLCNDGENLITSDGSHILYKLNSKLKMIGGFEVYSNRSPLANLNELEYVNGKIFANIYNSDQIFIINPTTGEAESYIDFSNLRSQLTFPRAEVLNGIAYLEDENSFLITGKYWDKMFVVKIKD